MKKSLLVAALIAAACSTAFAAEVKQDKAQVPAVKAQTMSDADMDKVTAGIGLGNETACNAGGTCLNPAASNNHASPQGTSVYPGSGVNTH